MRAIKTAYSVFDRPKLVQVGPVMEAIDIWNVEKIADIGSINGITHDDSGTALSTIRYVFDGQDCAASVGFRSESDMSMPSCSFCSDIGKTVSWCSHIQYLARTHEDWNLFQPIHHQGTVVAVPVIPTDGIYAGVKFRENREHPQFTDVIMELQVRDDPDPEPDPFVIGQVTGKFGMLELRSLIADFLEGWLSNERYYHPLDVVKRHDGSFTDRFYVASCAQTLTGWRAANVPDPDAVRW